ncbi:hypothetical protein T11_16421 [Trichinella zimbabwensis]|uniref:Uncharacterized protein n=1 Tax=Trichinella zimbabwensis TaxID=268475 RepID=A0A0V1GSB8_9BILA|nr:hypothetical protein T11_16421 [Trichinella zimbabwensis]
MNNIYILKSIQMLGFEKLFIILRTLIIRKTMQSTASHHTFTQQNSVNKYLVPQINISSYNFSKRNLRYYAISDGKLGCSTNNKRQII